LSSTATPAITTPTAAFVFMSTAPGKKRFNESASISHPSSTTAATAMAAAAVIRAKVAGQPGGSWALNGTVDDGMSFTPSLSGMTAFATPSTLRSHALPGDSQRI